MTDPRRASEKYAFQLYGVAKLYGATVALKPVTLSLCCGEILALLGPNGSGKTTLLRILGGATQATVGRAEVFGDELSRERGSGGDVGLLASETYLYDDLTAAENLRFAATMSGRSMDDERIAELLEQFGLGSQVIRVGGRAERVRSFSSGMKRRLSLARLLVLDAKLWLLDEPYNSLDEAACNLVDSTLLDHVARGGAAVLATHDAGRALSIADRVAELDRGSLRYQGPVSDRGLEDTPHVV